MSRIKVDAWRCDKCGYIWLVRRSPKTGKASVPVQCVSHSCRSRQWNSEAATLNMVGGVYGGAPEKPNEEFRRLRKKMRISQAKFGKLIGVTARQILNIESGRSAPSDRTFALFTALYSRHMEKLNA